MTKKAITFTAGWSRYNAGETAVFSAKQADELIAQKRAVMAKNQPKAADGNITVSIDVRGSDEAKEFLAEIARDKADLDKRQSELDAREVDLAARESALADLEQNASSAPAPAPAPAPDADASSSSKRDGGVGLPKQGR